MVPCLQKAWASSKECKLWDNESVDLFVQQLLGRNLNCSNDKTPPFFWNLACACFPWKYDLKNTKLEKVTRIQNPAWSGKKRFAVDEALCVPFDLFVSLDTGEIFCCWNLLFCWKCVLTHKESTKCICTYLFLTLPIEEKSNDIVQESSAPGQVFAHTGTGLVTNSVKLYCIYVLFSIRFWAPFFECTRAAGVWNKP